MTEAEWLTSEEPARMLSQLRAGHGPQIFRWFRRRSHITPASQRKLRLFATGCVRLIWDELAKLHHRVVEAAEGIADGLPWPDELPNLVRGLNGPDADRVAVWVLEWTYEKGTEWLDPNSREARWKVLASAQAQLIRDVFGNPFRPVTFSPSWRTSTAVALAGLMYESREFNAMPILADALQDAGCDNADVLNHCRGEGPHVRGCWVVDLVLGKE